jgi:dTDP-4-amino-4,6-dideoxygalactose transaminase
MGFQSTKELAVTQTICGEILSLPLYPSLTEEEIVYVGRTIKDAVS